MPEPGKEAKTSPPAPPTAPKASQAGKPTGWRKWLFRLAAVTLAPTLAFGLLEVGLRLAGYGYSTDFFVDGSRAERPGVLIDNPDFARWVFPRGMDDAPWPVPFALPATKAKNTYRIFVTGESAAMGFPDPSASFARVLEAMLRERYPDKHFEVVNASVVAINSHVVLPIARQCLQQSPDLLVVHLGNNEVVGPFGGAGVLGPYSPSLGLLRASLAVKTTRTGQLLSSALLALRPDAQGPRSWEGMSLFAGSHVRADDGRLQGIYGHFRENLRDICDAAAAAGVPVVVCTIPVNLKDCPPFGSAHAPGLGADRAKAWDEAYQEGVRLEAGGKWAEAVGRYEEAGRTDDQFADLAFRLGRCQAALGHDAAARLSFVRARDLDTLRFRSDTTINETIRSVAASRAGRGVYLADAERAFAEASPSGITGEELFLEHVHMNFHGNYLLARTVFETLQALDAGLPESRLGGPRTPLSEPECAERLGWTEWNELKVALQIGELTRRPPFTGQLDSDARDRRREAKLDELRARFQKDGPRKAIARYGRAEQAFDEDWMLPWKCGQLLAECGDAAGAEEQYFAALERLKHLFPAHCQLGNLMLAEGRTPEAVAHYREALRLSPNCWEAQSGLADAYAVQGKVAEGVAIHEAHLDRTPDRSRALAALGAYLSRNGRPDEARARFTEALRLNPDSAAAHEGLGDADLKEGKVDEALGHFEAALRVRPDWPELSARVAELRKGREHQGERGASAP